MSDQPKYALKHLALAIGIALGSAAPALAQHDDEAPSSQSVATAELTSELDAATNTSTPLTTEIRKTTEWNNLKLDERDDLIRVLSKGNFTRLLDGGGGHNVIQLDSKGGTLGETRNFNHLEIKQGVWTSKGSADSGDFSTSVLVSPKATLVNEGRIEGGAISQGFLVNNGWIGADVEVGETGSLSGKGRVGALNVRGNLVVNQLHGAPHVAGDLKMSNEAVLSYEIDAAGGGETIKVAGTASLGDATLKIVALSGEYPQSSQYTVIEANQIDGRFGKIENEFAFMKPEVEYAQTTARLTYARNDMPIEKLAITDNGQQLGASIIEPTGLPLTSSPENLSPDAVAMTPTSTGISETAASTATPATETEPATSPTPAAVPPVTAPKVASAANAAVVAILGADRKTASLGIEQLAAGNNANLAKVTLNSDAPVNTTMLAAMRQLDNSTGAGNQRNSPHLAAGNANNGRVWLQALGHGATVDRENDALKGTTQGLVLGTDWAIGEEWRVGLMAGQSRTRLDSRELDGDLDSWHLGAYAMRQSGPMSLRLGASYSNHEGSTKRRVAFKGFSDRPEGQYNAGTQQAFAEVGYNLGRANVGIEPFAGLGYQRYQRDGYTEKGGDAALKVHGQIQNNVNSTLGLRLAQLNTLDNGMQLTPHLSTSWKHTYGEVSTETRQRLVTGGRDYTVYGAPLDRDSLLVDAGLDLRVSANNTLGVSLNGEAGSDSRSYGVTGQWRIAF